MSARPGSPRRTSRTVLAGRRRRVGSRLHPGSVARYTFSLRDMSRGRRRTRLDCNWRLRQRRSRIRHRIVGSRSWAEPQHTATSLRSGPIRRPHRPCTRCLVRRGTGQSRHTLDWLRRSRLRFPRALARTCRASCSAGTGHRCSRSRRDRRTANSRTGRWRRTWIRATRVRVELARLRLAPPALHSCVHCRCQRRAAEERLARR